MAAAVVLSLFGGRVLQLQAVDASAYALAATRELTTSVIIPASRGPILDRTGVPLATTVEAVNVTVDQTLIGDRLAVARELAPLLGMTLRDVRTRITGQRRFAYVKKNVSPDMWHRVKAANLVGVFSEPAPRRTYPAGDVAGNVVGFVGSDGTALAGAERAFDPVLAGKPGHATYELGAGSRQIPIGGESDVPPTAGRGVRLTLDRDIQWYAQQVLAAKVKEAGARSGSLVVLDVRSGDVLALATAPTVDPGRPGRTRGADRGNRPVEEAYEPGSVEKPLTAAALFDSRSVTNSSVFTVPDSLHRGGHVIRDHDPHPTKQLTFDGIIAESSNVGTILASERMDKDLLRRYLAKFGLGSKPGLGLPAETAGDLPASFTDLSRDTIAFGQGVSVSIVQMADAYQAIANGGLRLPARLVAGYVGSDGTVEPTPRPEPVRVVSARAAAQTRRAMEAVMQKGGGTGAKIEIPGYRLAGKTGTAQQVSSSCGCYRDFTASFMGFAPADAPRLAIAVSLQRPVNGHYGGVLAGPVWRDVMSFALQRMHVPPTGRKAPTVPLFPAG